MCCGVCPHSTRDIYYYTRSAAVMKLMIDLIISFTCLGFSLQNFIPRHELVTEVRGHCCNPAAYSRSVCSVQLVSFGDVLTIRSISLSLPPPPPRHTKAEMTSRGFFFVWLILTSLGLNVCKGYLIITPRDIGV